MAVRDAMQQLRRPASMGRSLRWQFDHNDGRLMHKWLHYFPIYERHLSPFRGGRPKVLEIGVSHGGSLQMWKRYFGRGASIVGVDIDERVAALAERQIVIEIGDQSDRGFLQSLAARHGPFDVIVDDGSHLPDHQIASIEVLWPHVKPGGVYLVEDLHTSYWPDYGGGWRVDTTFMEWTKARLDDLNAFHSREPAFVVTDWARSIRGIHAYDSVVVFDRDIVEPPEVRMTGRPSFSTTYGTDTELFIDDAHRAQLATLSRPMARLRRAARDPRGAIGRLVRRVRPKIGP